MSDERARETEPEFMGHMELMRDVSRLREIERVFNEGWLPEIPGETPSIKTRSLRQLRALIPEFGSGDQPDGTPS